MTGQWLGKEMIYFEECDSTNLRAQSLNDDQRQAGTVLVAGHQTAGKGRWGRVWESGAGQSLLFTAILPLPAGNATGPHVAIALAVAVARVLEARGLGVKLKWPNDVMIQGRKLAGMLMEARRDCLIAGIGLNLGQQEPDFPPEIRSQATSLRLEKAPAKAEELLAESLEAIEKELKTLEKDGFQTLKEAWHERALYLGDPVRIKTAAEDGEPREGTVMGLDSDAALLLRSDHGMVLPVVAGDLIQLRPLSQSS